MGGVATVYVPSMLRPLAGGNRVLEIPGSTVGEIVAGLKHRYPELGDRLTEHGRLRGSLSVAIDGEVSTLGLLDAVGPDSEVHFVPAIAGGTEAASAVAVG